MTLSRPHKVFWLALAGLIFATAPGNLLAAPALSAEDVKKEVARYSDLGGEYSEKGFSDLPPKMTPFAQWRRIDTNRIQGKEVYVFQKKVRIWKTMFCGRRGTIYLELSLMDRKGKQIPFAWQECKVDCQGGGFCGAETKIFIDITGNGDADIMIPKMSDLGKMKKGFLKNPRFVFEKDVIPLWVKKVFGPKFKNLNTIGPRDSVASWKDHPLTVEPEEKGGDL
jgi:hypothetical protein